MMRRLAVACVLSLLLCPSLCGCAHPPPGLTLTIWSAPTGVEERGFLRLCRRFEREHPGIHIDNLGALTEDKLIRAIVAGVPPDLAYLYGTSDVGPLAANGAILPLDARFRQSGLQDQQFLASAIRQGRYHGHLYAMPVTRDCQALYWNRTVFRKAGLDPDRPPRTVEELFEMARRLTKRRPDGSLTRLGFLPLPGDPVALLVALGGQLEDPRTGAVTLDAPENCAALAKMVEMVDALGGRTRVAAFQSSFGRSDSVQNPLATGKVAMTIDGEWVAMYLEKYAPTTDYSVGEVPYPGDRPDLQNLAWQDGDVMILPRGARHPDAAWEFMRWMQLPRQQEEYAAHMNNLPSIRALLSSPALTRGSRKKEALGYILRHIAGQSHNARTFPTIAASRLCRDTLANAIESAELHQKSPAAALRDAQHRVQQELARYTG